MKHRMYALVTATAVSAAAFAAPGFAMENELTMLEQAVKNELQALNVQSDDVSYLTLAQVAEVKAVLDSDGTTQAKVQQIDEIMNQSPDAPAGFESLANFNGTSSLEQIIANDLSGLGVEVEDPTTLTVAQLGQLKAVLESDEPTETKKLEAETIIAQ